MMKSRTLTDNIIARFKLKEVYKQDFLTDARATLQANVKMIDGKDGIIAIDVDELYKLTKTLTASLAK